jgi:hypothetical protein
LHFAGTSLLGNGNDMWVSRRSELSCGCSDRSSRDRSRRSRSGGGWRRGWLVGNEAATDDRRKAWHESSTRGEHFGSECRRSKLLRQLCESWAVATKKVGDCSLPSWLSEARASDERERVSISHHTNAPAHLCSALTHTSHH